MTESREVVQYCPCGCVAYLSASEIRDLGASKQLEDIKAGKKLDAVILPSRLCATCHCERSEP